MITTLLILSLFVQRSITQQWIEKQPIYVREDQDEEVKDIFLRRIRAQEDGVQRSQTPVNFYVDIPQPGGFKSYEVKTKRQINDGEYFENSKRLRRDLDGNTKSLDKNKNTQDNLSRFSESHEGQQRTQRMLLQKDVVPEGSREPRGATKEQWVKQPYPVRVTVDDNNYEDNVPAASSVRAPRVHFVTQTRLESAPPLVYTNYERKGRARDTFRDTAKDFSRSPSRLPPPRSDRDYYLSDPPSKQLPPYPSRPYNIYRDDPYYRYEEFRYDPRYGPYENDRDRFEHPNRQRRIIYYATLPEVVRTPPNVNLRNRYTYRERYDDRYMTSPSLSVGEGNPYRFGKPYELNKSRYDQETERAKAPYPLKVSTDVNVRETKKNPERRIYSEPDSRYAYKSPAYQAEETFNQRT